jgi:acetylornithine/N-succinyldiaminopimelate aminotransferase
MSTNHIMPTYRRLDLTFDRGEGSWLYTNDGERYLDFGSGIAVTTLGHSHPELVQALKDQGEKLWHVSNLFTIPEQQALADRLCDLSFADQVFFCNSGAEAVEGLIKTIRKYFAAKGHPEKYKIITFEGAFHGRTHGALAASGNEAYLDGFGPALPGFTKVESFDLDAVKAVIDDETAAIFIEPIQGEGGVRAISPAFLRGLRELADEYGLLLAFDEVQCGIARTGKLFAHELAGVSPDVMSIAKGLGGGFPIGAFLATHEAASGMVAGSHGSTYGGNPLGCAVASKVLEIVSEPDFLQSVEMKALSFRQSLSRLVDQYPNVLQGLRGEGLMVGLHCKIENTKLVEALRDEKVISVGAGENTVRLLPPLNISPDDLAVALQKLEAACQAIDPHEDK